MLVTSCYRSKLRFWQICINNITILVFISKIATFYRSNTLQKYKKKTIIETVEINKHKNINIFGLLLSITNFLFFTTSLVSFSKKIKETKTHFKNIINFLLLLCIIKFTLHFLMFITLIILVPLMPLAFHLGNFCLVTHAVRHPYICAAGLPPLMAVRFVLHTSSIFQLNYSNTVMLQWSAEVHCSFY